MIVRMKSIIPDPQHNSVSDGIRYAFAIDVREWLSQGADGPGEDRVDSSYLIKVYEILGKNRTTSDINTW